MGITVNSLTKKQYDQWIFAMLKTFEGLQDDAYVDTNGFPTIGIGFQIDQANTRFILDGMGYGALQKANPTKFSVFKRLSRGARHVAVGSRAGIPATARRIASPAPTLLNAQYPMSVRHVSNDSSQAGSAKPHARFNLAQDNTE